MEKRQRRDPTTITNLGNDLLCEIFARLPSLPSLVRAALACPTFLHAVRSSPVFRRRFQSLHPPHLLGFFSPRIPSVRHIHPFTPISGRFDPDHTAVIRGADFFFTNFTENREYYDRSWEVQNCYGGYVLLVNLITEQLAAYNPVTHSIVVLPYPPDATDLSGTFGFHIVFSEEDPSVFHLLYIRQNKKMRACTAVFSSATREWIPIPQPDHGGDDGGAENITHLDLSVGWQVNGMVYWKHAKEGSALVLSTATFEFSEIDLPALLVQKKSQLFALGHTKDGKLCMAGIDESGASRGNLFVWLRGADDDGVETWILKDTFPLDMFINDEDGEDDTTVQVEELIDGVVYLSSQYGEQGESLGSLHLDTKEVDMLFADTYARPAHPYIMAWPPSLICNKEDSGTEVTTDRVANAGPAGTEESPSVLVAALQLYKEALMNADEVKVAEIEAFFTSYG